MSTPTYTPLSLSGSSASSGSAAFTVLLLTPVALSGSSASSVSLTLTSSAVAGGFDDFALVPYEVAAEYADPIVTYPTNIVPRIAPSDTVNAWQRISLTCAAPVAYAPGAAGTLYNAAAYARLRVITTSMPVPSAQEIAYLQFEKTPGNLANLNSDRFGVNLLTLNQASYEGPMLYVTPDTGATYTRSTHASCGLYGGRYLYNTPPAANTYTALQSWGTYQAARDNRASYSALTFNPAPGAPPGSGTGLSVFLVQPTPAAMCPVVAGTTIQASIAVNVPAAGVFFSCQVQFFDATFALVSGTITGTATTSVANAGFVTVAATGKVPTGAVYGAVVPLVTTSSAVNTMTFYADEHRLYVPSTFNPTGSGGTSAARPWQAPKLVTITPAATRVNLAQNPSFQNNLTGYTSQNPVGITPTFVLTPSVGVSGGNAADWLATNVPPSAINNTTLSPWAGITTSATGAVMAPLLKPSTTYTVSCYVRPISGSPGVTIWANDGTTLRRGNTTPPRPFNGTGPYTRLSVTITTSSSFGGNLILNLGFAGGDVGYYYSAVTPGTDPNVWVPVDPGAYTAWSASTAYAPSAFVTYAGSSWQASLANGPFTTIPFLHFYVDNVLVEASGQLNDYFDGNNPSADYLWESTAGNSRSHYYQGKSANQYRLSQAVQRALPVGASYQIVYAAPPS